MIKNYIKIVLRNLIRDKRTLALNVLGLSVGIAAALLLYTVVRYETSFDTFHSNAQQIYRVVTQDQFDTGMKYNPGVPNPVPEALKADLPNLKRVVPVQKYDNCQFTLTEPLSGHPNKFKEEAVYFTEPEYFDLFDHDWLSGNPSVLKEPAVIVLDRAIASKFFGDWTQAVGQTLMVENALPVQVAGVIESIPSNTNFPLRLIISFETVKAYPDLLDYDPQNWGGTSSNFQTYVLLDESASKAAVDRQLEAFNAKHYKGVGVSEKSNHLQPLGDIHFDTRFGPLKGTSVRRSTIDTLILIGIVIVLMASVNFINIATAQAITRSKEVSVRKVLGAQRGQLIAMALSETLLVTVIAAGLAMLLAWTGMPYLRHLSNVPDTMDITGLNTVGFLLAVIAAITLMAGMYPALALSRFEPVRVLKNKINTVPAGGIPLRRALVVFQFAITQILVVGTLVTYRQLILMQETDLGFDQAVYYVNLPWEEDQLQNKAFFKQQLLQLASVQSASLTTDAPSSDNNWSNSFYFDRREEALPFHTSLKFGDADYFETFGLRFLAGKGFSARDTLYEAVINETLLHKLGMQEPEEALGKTVRLGGQEVWMEITGVVRDFATNSLREEIKPILIASNNAWYQIAGIKLRTGNTRQALAAIQDLWESHFPDLVYDGRFLDESIAGFYRQENQLARVYQLFAGLAIFISCLGLFGIVSFVAVQRTKEIGIRKVLGASVTAIVILLSSGFVRLVLIAAVIASPVAWWVMTKWLEDFAYRVTVEWWMFAATGLIAVVIALLTVSFQAIKAAVANPVDSLRDE